MLASPVFPSFTSFPARRPAVLILGLALCCLASGSALWAHDDVHAHIREASAELKENPERGDLWLKRARLYMQDKSWQRAVSDLEKALEVDPEQYSALYFLAQSHVAAKAPKDALAAIDRYLQALPGDSGGERFRGGMLRGDILRDLGKPNEAADAYGQALPLAEYPRPSHYLALARALNDADRATDAVAILDSGLRKLGSVASLESLAVDTLAGLGRTDEAVTRLERLATSAKNPARWRVDQGDILSQAGKTDEARTAYEQALKAIEGLPAGRRAVDEMKELAERAQAGLQKLQQ